MSLWSRLLRRTPAPKPGMINASRMFESARPSRLTDGWTPLTSSADTESLSSLTRLRDRSRALVRDNAHAKRARTVIVNNVIGTGIGLQAQVVNARGRLLEDVNAAIESAWEDWCRAENCHVAGALHFSDLERLLVAECFEAGDVFVRLHRRGSGPVPLSLEVIESERLAADYEIKPEAGNVIRQGIECDAYYRPVAYWIRSWHPGEFLQPVTPDFLMRVPASEILHLKVTDRWPQVRGVPWMHAAMGRLHQLGEFQSAAVVAARIGAEKVMVLKETEDGRLGEALGTTTNDGHLTWDSGKGQIDILPSGTDVVPWSPNYPDTNFDPFVRAALRDVAAAFGVSYESLSRDYSQSNYSSSRLALLDDRDGWRVLQQWFIRAVRERLHDTWLQTALMARAIPGLTIEQYLLDRAKFGAVKWKPRGWSWVDPTKEVNAYKEAERAGYITKGQIIAATGGGDDLEDVLRARRRELDLLTELDLHTDTTEDPAPVAPPAAAARPDEDDDKKARVFALKRGYE